MQLRQYPRKDKQMKRLLYLLQISILGLFIITLAATAFQLLGTANPLSKYDYDKPENNRVEDFDPSLNRLNSLHKLEKYCDSLIAVTGCTVNSKDYPKKYSDFVAAVIRKRFYHGYSNFDFSNNYLSVLFSRISLQGYNAQVIPDDILKHPFAACSQQSIIMMEVLKAKDLKTRKISFNGKKSGGHFCFEVFYNESWHLYDPNMEPDIAELNLYGRPGIAFLTEHPDILTKAYKQYPKEEILDIFPTYSYGEVNVFPAPRAIIFQRVTKFLSYTLWLFFLIAFLLVRRKYKRLASKKYVWNNRIYFPKPETSTTPSDYRGITAPGS